MNDLIYFTGYVLLCMSEYFKATKFDYSTEILRQVDFALSQVERTTWGFDRRCQKMGRNGKCVYSECYFIQN